MKALFTFIFSIITMLLIAQQPAQYTIYMYNPYGIHPAAAGAENAIVATGVYRQQWAELQAAPVSQEINAHLPFNRLNSGFGINLENDKVGVEQSIAATLTYAYRMQLNQDTRLALALNGGILQKSINGEAIRTPEGTYTGSIFNHNDLFLTENSTSAKTILLDASLYFQRKNIRIGLTAKNLIDNHLNYAINNSKIRLIKNYLFTFATDFEVGSNLIVKPSLLLRSDFKELQTEISLLNEWKQKFYFGVSYRGYNKISNDAIAILGGFKLNENLTLIYAYDVSLSPLKTTNTGSHELLLRYSLSKTFEKVRPQKIIYNPRYY